jgi:hypothetical protein
LTTAAFEEFAIAAHVPGIGEEVKTAPDRVAADTRARNGNDLKNRAIYGQSV